MLLLALAVSAGAAAATPSSAVCTETNAADGNAVEVVQHAADGSLGPRGDQVD